MEGPHVRPLLDADNSEHAEICEAAMTKGRGLQSCADRHAVRIGEPVTHRANVDGDLAATADA